MCLFMTILRLLTFQKINLRISLILTLILLRLMKIPSSIDVEYVEGITPNLSSKLEGDGDVIPEVGWIEETFFNNGRSLRENCECQCCPDCEDSQFCHSSRVSQSSASFGIRYL
ncbi:hypothetical protein Tco_1514859 [Tanacetum coccineum]